MLVLRDCRARSRRAGVERIDGALLDLGISSPQIDDPARGFSFRADGPLDMRMDPTRGESAAAFLARATARELTEVIRDYGEERFAQSIAGAIVAARAVAPVVRTRQLAAIVAQAVGTRPRGDRSQDPATRTFQALRIFVNRELAELALILPAMVPLLATRGRLAVISFHSLEDRIVKRFFASASQPFGGDPRLARLAIRTAALPGAPLALVGRAIRPARTRDRARIRVRAAQRCAWPSAPRIRCPRASAPRRERDDMVRVNLMLLAVLVLCALSLVTSRHQARKLFVELEREQARARAYETEFGQLQLEQSTWAMPVRVEKIAREQLKMQMPGTAAHRGRAGRGGAMTGRSAALTRAAPAPELPRFRAPIVFALLLLLFVVLVGRSLYLQWIDNAFLQEQGSSRYSREIEVPAHRGRIVDRAGEPLAISTPVKSIWAFPGQVDATPEKLALLAQALETTPRALAKKLEDGNDFVFLAKQVPPEVAERVAALKIKGVHDQNEYRRFYPAGEMASHIVGFTGDHDVGQEGIELTQQEWLGGKPGSRRVIINRRGDVVEDVESIRAPQAGRDLALAIDARLQYLAFRELKAAVEANRAKAGGLVILDAQTGEILALANWPTYNPNARNKVARDRMRNRALTDVFEPGSTLKPFTIAAALESGAVRPDTVIQTAAGR